MQLEALAIARSIDNFAVPYLHYLYFKYDNKKCCVSSKNLQNFNRILRKIQCEAFV